MLLYAIFLLICRRLAHSYLPHNRMRPFRFSFNRLPHLSAKVDKTLKPAAARKTSNTNLAPTSSSEEVPSDPWKLLIKKLDSAKAPKVSLGKMERVESQIPDELQCPHFGVCSGCSIQGNFADSPIIRRSKSFFKQENIPITIHTSNATQWRTTVKLAVQPTSRWGGIKIGLYRVRSHVVESIPDCRVHHPAINAAVDIIRQAALDTGVQGYQEVTDGNAPSGHLRYISMSVERYTGKVQLVLVWNAFNYKSADPSLYRLIKTLKSKTEVWHSITINFQTSEGNAILNYNTKAWKLVWGPPMVRETIGNATFYFKPQIFRQSNLDFFESGIVPLVVRNIPPGSQVAELYSGVGVLGLNAASSGRAEEVLCSDSNAFVDEVFDSCADSLPPDKKESVFFECLSAEDSVLNGQCTDADVILVDPPRKGLDEAVIQLLTNTHESAVAQNVKRLIYVSCGFDALERDTRLLLDSGFWKIRSADGFVLFPGTDHLETVVVFDRK